MAYAIINTAAMAATNVDSYNLDGKYTSGDLENGVIVTLNGMNINSTSKLAEGFDYTVALADSNTAGDAYIIATAEVGVDENNIWHDPRKFINKAGRPLAIKKLVASDLIEVSKDAFGSAAYYPATTEIGYYVPVAANGKLGDPQSSAISAKVSFRVEALTKMAVGDEKVDGCILRVMIG